MARLALRLAAGAAILSLAFVIGCDTNTRDFPQDRLQFARSIPPPEDPLQIEAPDQTSARCDSANNTAGAVFPGHMFVDVAINGRRTARMLVDTGAGNTVVGPQIAADGDVALSSVQGTAYIMKMQIPITVAQAQSLQVGKARATNVPMIVWRKDVVFNFAGIPVWSMDGLLGMDFLQHFAVVLDYRRSQVDLLRQPYAAGDAPRAALTVTNDESAGLAQYRPVMAASINGQTVSSLLDSGQSVPLVIPRQTWDALNLGALPMRMVDFQAGDIVLKGVLARRTDRYEHVIVGPSAFFGSGYKRLIMDFPAQKLYVEK